MLTGLYAGILGIVFLALSFWVIAGRRQWKVSIGDGGHDLLARRIRMHANFAEFVPISLILMLCADIQGAPAPALHAVGVLLLAGRLMHVAGIATPQAPFYYRVGGMMLTFSSIIAGIIINIVFYFI